MSEVVIGIVLVLISIIIPLAIYSAISGAVALIAYLSFKNAGKDVAKKRSWKAFLITFAILVFIFVTSKLMG